MRTGEAARRLGVDRTTIVNWIAHEALSDLFSPEARGEDRTQRVLNDDDVSLLATIHVLRTRDDITEWDMIRDYLETGKRESLPPLDGVSTTSTTVSRPYAEQSARAAATLAERDSALAEVGRLRDELIAQDERHQQKVSSLYEEIRRLEREIGRLSALLEVEKDRRNESSQSKSGE